MHIAIIGGSVAGAFAAFQLRHSLHQITIFDPRAPWEKPCGGCVQASVFQQYPILRESSCVWNYPARLRLISSFGDETLAFTPEAQWGIVSRHDLNQSLLQSALCAENVHLIPERVNRVSPDGAGWRVKTASGRVVSADLLIGADGVASLVRKTLLGSLPREHLGRTVGYLLGPAAREEAVVKTFDDIPGYLWYFPRVNQISAGIGSRLAGPSAGELWRRLDAFLADYCPQATKEKRWGALIPFVSTPDFWDRPCAGENWAVIGDAAGHVHPLSEAGIYYALASADLVAQAILQGSIQAYDLAWRQAYGQPLRQASEILEKAGHDYRTLERVVQGAMGAPPAKAPPGGKDLPEEDVPSMLHRGDAIGPLKTAVQAYFSQLRALHGYPALHEWLMQWLDARCQPWAEFALLCSRLVGGCSPADLARVLSGWLMLFCVSGPLDDYADEDKDLDEAWASLGWKRGNFVGLALLAEALGIVLGDEGAPPLARAAGVLLGCLQASALGQALDVAQVQTLEAYEQMLELKAAALTAALSEGVAQLADVDASRRQAMVTCGREVGMALQIVNDYLGVWQQTKVVKRPGGDLAQAQLTYPMFYALIVPHPHQAEFRALLGQAPAERDTARMLEILNTIGAPAFMRAAIELRKTRALQAVREISPESIADFENWCNRYLLGESR